MDTDYLHGSPASIAKLPERTSQAREASDNIEKAAVHLAETVALLEDRLGPILRDVPTAAAEAAPRPDVPCSAHTVALRQHVDQITKTRYHVESILERLDI